MGGPTMTTYCRGAGIHCLVSRAQSLLFLSLTPVFFSRPVLRAPYASALATRSMAGKEGLLASYDRFVVCFP